MAKRLADVVACVNETNANREDDRTDDPGGYLNERGPASVDRRMQVIENSKQEERNPAEQIEVGMRGHGRVIAEYGHNDSPDHSDDHRENGSREAH